MTPFKHHYRLVEDPEVLQKRKAKLPPELAAAQDEKRKIPFLFLKVEKKESQQAARFDQIHVAIQEVAVNINSVVILANLKHALDTSSVLATEQSLLVTDAYNRRALEGDQWQRPTAEVCEELDASDKDIDNSELLSLTKTSFGFIMIGMIKVTVNTRLD
jgi:hypothetical protein